MSVAVLSKKPKLLTKKVFQERLFRRAKSRYGITLTDKKIRFWFERGVLNNRSAENSTNVWTATNYWKALKACRWNQKGKSDCNIIMLMLWLSGSSYPIHKIGQALCDEYRRARRKIIRTVRSKYIKHPEKPLSAIKFAAIIRSFGEVDQCFVRAGIILDDSFLVTMFELMRYGNNSAAFQNTGLQDNLLSILIAIGIPESAASPIVGPFTTFMREGMILMASDGCSAGVKKGRFNFIETKILEASSTDAGKSAFLKARHYLKSFLLCWPQIPYMLSCIFPAYGNQIKERWEHMKILPDLLSPQWKIALLVWAVNMTIRGTDKKILENISLQASPDFLAKGLEKIAHVLLANNIVPEGAVYPCRPIRRVLY